MLHHGCGTCRAPLHADDGDSECMRCLGKSHAEAALTEITCSHCESMSLASLCSRIAFFSESDSAPRALPFSSSPGPVRKKQRGRGSQRSDETELTPAQVPCTSLSPQREVSPVRFSHPDQRPSAIVSDLVSFGGSDEKPLDDSISIVASDAEEWSFSLHDPAPLPSLEPIDTRTSIDSEFTRVLSKAIEQLGLEWSAPHEPTRSRLDEWFLPGRRHAPPQRAAPFFPEVHDELTKSWHAPYSARLHPPASHTLISIDGAEQKGYEKLPLLYEAVSANLCPSAAIGWKTKVAHPSKPYSTTSALAGWAYSSAGQAASALHTVAVYQAKLLRALDEAGHDSATFKELCSATDLALALCATKTTTQAIGRSMASLVVLERHLWLTLTEIKDAVKAIFLDSPVSPTGLFGPAVDGFAEYFTATQKSSQAMRHFLPKRSSSTASSRRQPLSPRHDLRTVSALPSAGALAICDWEDDYSISFPVVRAVLSYRYLARALLRALPHCSVVPLRSTA
ncbi:hypothetical protein DPX16_22706 [Anabarilius grahami]|uniref:Uncharacterized protein n=1 Tax=Anabarilius grahami TaxID=495550 RepID=A0A3N0XXT1_ANAGA|nr:hypothetical protein DPX16_22706 [Anabarilius grahami]